MAYDDRKHRRSRRRRLVAAAALTAAVLVPSSPAGAATTPEARCAEAMSLVRVPKLVPVRCIPVPYPYGEGWTVPEGEAGLYRHGACICGDGWVSHVEVYSGRPVAEVAFTIGHELGHAYAATTGGPWRSEAYADHWGRCVTTRTASCT